MVVKGACQVDHHRASIRQTLSCSQITTHSARHPTWSVVLSILIDGSEKTQVDLRKVSESNAY